MKKIITILVVSLFMACNTKTKKEVTTPNSEILSIEKIETKTMASGDYSTLLVNFSCGIDTSEIAKVLGVPESDLKVSDYSPPKKCHLELKGFGENTIGGQTRLMWGSSPSSKSQNKKEIQNYLKNQEEYSANVIQHMSIALADTKDCYIAQQPAHGRILIYNENYDTAFVLNYGRRGEFKRSQEQHEELKAKMTDLANFLLKKHRK